MEHFQEKMIRVDDFHEENITRWTVKAVSDLSRIMQENEQSEQHEHFYVYDQPPIIITDVVSGKQLYNMLHN